MSADRVTLGGHTRDGDKWPQARTCAECKQTFYLRSKKDLVRRKCLRCDPPDYTPGVKEGEETDLQCQALAKKEKRLVREHNERVKKSKK